MQKDGEEPNKEASEGQGKQLVSIFPSLHACFLKAKLDQDFDLSSDCQ